MGIRVGLILFFQPSSPPEFLAGPEFDSGESQRQPLDRYREARMHQDAANRMRPQRARRLVAPTVDALRDADRF